jgi:diaminopimelate decarboxylase
VKYFAYKEKDLFCEDVQLKELAEEFGTPLYVYSRNQLVENFHSIDDQFKNLDHRTCYALKANSNVFLLRTLAEEGAGADVVSAGELYLALKAGFKPEHIVFAGVGKREDELEYALNEGIHCFNVESTQELQLLSLVALRLQKTARVALRINPDIDAESHPYVSTGLKQHKFGIESGQAVEAFRFAKGLPNLEIIGVHTHIGSQIVKVGPYVESATFIANLVQQLRGEGFTLSHIDLGGGLGVQYMNALVHEAIPPESTEQAVPTSSDFFSAVIPILQQTGCSIWLEPGRSIVADAGILLTQVLYTKEMGQKKFVIVDAAMNDLLRPSLYNAYHQIVPTTIDTYEHEKVDVVGPICETGDFFAKERLMSRAKQKDTLAILTTGAYGFVNASNYNSRLRPAEVLVNGDRVRVIRQRQSLDQLL